MAQASKSSKVQAGILFTAIGVAGLAIAFSQMSDPGEPHYTRAKEMVEGFERGKEPLNIDYDNPLYGEALGELDQVLASSKYFEPARELTGKIQANIDDFHRRRAALAAERKRAQELNQQRNAEFVRIQQRRRLEPDPNYEECEHGLPHEH